MDSTPRIGDGEREPTREHVRVKSLLNPDELIRADHVSAAMVNVGGMTVSRNIPAGHDAWVAGDERLDTIAWRGARTWLEPLAALTERVLASILFTDLVDSTGQAERLGDRA